MSGKVLKLTNENFNFTVKEASTIALVDFYADWCGPCRTLSPVITKLAEDNPTITIAKVDSDEERLLTSEYLISSLPTILIFKEGVVIERIVGVKPLSYLQKLLNNI